MKTLFTVIYIFSFSFSVFADRIDDNADTYLTGEYDDVDSIYSREAEQLNDNRRTKSDDYNGEKYETYENTYNQGRDDCGARCQ